MIGLRGTKISYTLYDFLSFFLSLVHFFSFVSSIRIGIRVFFLKDSLRLMSLGGLWFRVLTNVGVYDEFGRFMVLGF